MRRPTGPLFEAAHRAVNLPWPCHSKAKQCEACSLVLIPGKRWAPSKYRAVRTGGYASKGEAAFAAELKALERAGAITDLKEQVTFRVEPPGCERISWRVDFTYRQDGMLVAHEYKGYETPEYVIKRKLFCARYPEIVLRIARKGKGGAIISETVAPASSG